MRFTKKPISAVLLSAVMLAAGLFLIDAASAAAQSTASATPFGLDKGQVAPLEIGGQFIYLHANAPPALCGCFSLYGGGGTLVVNGLYGLGLVADLSGGRANKIAGTAQDIKLFDYLFGVRYSRHTSHRFTPYVEALGGRSNETSNYAAVESVNNLAAAAGGGVNVVLHRRVGVNVEADYVYSQLPNGANNVQNDVRVKTGVFFRFSPR